MPAAATARGRKSLVKKKTSPEEEVLRREKAKVRKQRRDIELKLSLLKRREMVVENQRRAAAENARMG